MSTYSEQQGGPGAVLWAVILTIILIAMIILFSGCERDICMECTTKVSGAGLTQTSKSILCGDFTAREIHKMERTITISASGIKTVTTCVQMEPDMGTPRPNRQ